MPEQVITNYRQRRENQRFFLNSQEIYGIQNASIQYQNNITPFKYLAMGGCVGVIPNGPQVGNISLTYLSLDTDRFYSYTGDSCFNGYIITAPTNTTDNFSFTSGYLTSYSSKCSIGQIPEVSVGILSVGNVGKITSEESDQVLTDFSNIASFVKNESSRITEFGAIELTFDAYSTNRVLAYDINLSVDRNPIYRLGNRFPTRVETNYPITVDLTFQLDKNEYSAMTLRDFPCNSKVQTIGIKLNYLSPGTGTLQEFSFEDMMLVGESYGIGIDGNVTVSPTYRTFLMP